MNGRDPLGLCFGVDDLSCWAWYVAYLKALGQTAGELARDLGGAIHGTADFATLGSLSSLSAQFEILRSGEGTLEERSRQAALAGIQARLDVVSLGFASAPDRAAHGRSIVSSALGLDEQSEGARQIAEACFVASEAEACILAATRWGGGASKTALFLATLGQGARAGSVRRRAPSGGEALAPRATTGQLRRVGDLLESAHDVMANPSLLQGKSLAQVRTMIGRTPGWVDDVMRRSTTHPQGGWVFREMNAAGTEFTGRLIQFHPGTPRHFGAQPYWKVSGVPGQAPIRIPLGP